MRSPRLFVDSADTTAVAALLECSLVHGVTTNPTVLDRAGRTAADIPALHAEWESLGAREIFFQAWGDTRFEIERRARRILDLGASAVVKIVATPDGFSVAAKLAASGEPVLLTGVYSPAQALVAASLGVRYIAPYLGRVRDAGLGGVDEIARMQQVAAGAVTEVLAASLRSPEDLVDLALQGITAFTAAPTVIDAMLRNEATTEASEGFAAARSLVPGDDDW